MNIITGPVPPYANVPIEPQFYQPRRFVIEDISLGQTTLVTTTEDMDYVIGQQIKLIIPSEFGCQGLSGQSGFVLSIPAGDQVEINIYSSGLDPYFAAVSDQEPQILAIGDVNTGAQNATGRTNNATAIPGAFINISPL